MRPEHGGQSGRQVGDMRREGKDRVSVCTLDSSQETRSGLVTQEDRIDKENPPAAACGKERYGCQMLRTDAWGNSVLKLKRLSGRVVRLLGFLGS